MCSHVLNLPTQTLSSLSGRWRLYGPQGFENFQVTGRGAAPRLVVAGLDGTVYAGASGAAVHIDAMDHGHRRGRDRRHGDNEYYYGDGSGSASPPPPPSQASDILIDRRGSSQSLASVDVGFAPGNRPARRRWERGAGDDRSSSSPSSSSRTLTRGSGGVTRSRGTLGRTTGSSLSISSDSTDTMSSSDGGPAGGLAGRHAIGAALAMEIGDATSDDGRAADRVFDFGTRAINQVLLPLV